MPERQTVLLVGGTSYVAGGVIRALAPHGYRILVVTRRPQIAQILLGDMLERVEAVSMEEAVKRAAGTPNSIVNLAYVKNAPKHKVYQQTRALIEAVDRLAIAARSDRVVHTSTVAVFGYRFARRPRPVPVPWRPGDGYTDLKIYAEHSLSRAASRSGYGLALVRLGNVIGPGANPWTAAIAHNMLEGRPVGRVGRLGFSNTTYVDNIGTYVRHLIQAPVSFLTAFGPYHHLAEFSSRSWKEILDRMATAIGDYRLLESSDDGREHEFGLPSARQIAKQVYLGPVGNRLRAALASRGDLPWLDSLVTRMKDPVELSSPPVTAAEQAQFDLIGNPIEFTSYTLAGWTPTVSFDEAMDAICSWTIAAGYSVRV